MLVTNGAPVTARRTQGLPACLAAIHQTLLRAKLSGVLKETMESNNRTSLTAQHLHHCMRIALTTYTPDFTVLAKSKKKKKKAFLSLD